VSCVNDVGARYVHGVVSAGDSVPTCSYRARPALRAMARRRGALRSGRRRRAAIRAPPLRGPRAARFSAIGVKHFTQRTASMKNTSPTSRERGTARSAPLRVSDRGREVGRWERTEGRQ
jgi:hypothetical protein